VLLQALGVQPRVGPEIIQAQLRAGDVLLLCSDGLTGPLPDDAILELMLRYEDPVRCCRALTEAACAAGGPRQRHRGDRPLHRRGPRAAAGPRRESSRTSSTRSRSGSSTTMLRTACRRGSWCSSPAPRGFIGSHVVDLLLRPSDATCSSLDDLSHGERENLARAMPTTGDPRLQLVVADLRGDLAALAGLRPDAVLHLAAQISVTALLDEPLADLDINLRATVRLLQWAAAVGARRLVSSWPRRPRSTATRADACLRGHVPIGHPRPTARASGRPSSTSTASARRSASRPRRCACSTSTARGRTRQPLQRRDLAVHRPAPARARRWWCSATGQQTRDFVYVGDVARAFAPGARRPEASAA
jgi:hypothetical protein